MSFTFPKPTIEAIKGQTFNQSLSYQEIQRRALPVQDNTLDKEEWRYRSIDGFIGQNEDFAQVLVADHNQVSHMGMSHISIAQNLRRLVEQVECIRKDRA